MKIMPAITETNENDRASSGCCYMRPKQAAEYCGLSESNLAKLRMQHLQTNGPRFLKISGCVVYRRTDLENWMDSHEVISV